MPKIAVDAMGGDRAPEVVVEGAMLATEELGVEVVLVGQREVVEQQLTRHGAHRLEIVSASQIVELHETPSSARRKKDSPTKVACAVMKRGEVQAVLNAATSAATMAP